MSSSLHHHYEMSHRSETAHMPTCQPQHQYYAHSLQSLAASMLPNKKLEQNERKETLCKPCRKEKEEISSNSMMTKMLTHHNPVQCSKNPLDGSPYN
jgi:hypothetical protein